MKKLMIAAAIVCAAAMSQAATYNWQVATQGASLYNLDGTKFSGTGYVFAGDNDATAVAAAFDILVAGGDMTAAAGYAGSVDFSAGETSSIFNYGDDAGTYAFTMLVKGNDGNLLVADYWEGEANSKVTPLLDAALGWMAEAETRSGYIWFRSRRAGFCSSSALRVWLSAAVAPNNLRQTVVS